MPNKWYALGKAAQKNLFPDFPHTWKVQYKIEQVWSDKTKSYTLYMYRSPTRLCVAVTTLLSPFLCFIHGYHAVASYLKELWSAEVFDAQVVAGEIENSKRYFEILRLAKEIKN